MAQTKSGAPRRRGKPSIESAWPIPSTYDGTDGGPGRLAHCKAEPSTGITATRLPVRDARDPRVYRPVPYWRRISAAPIRATSKTTGFPPNQIAISYRHQHQCARPDDAYEPLIAAIRVCMFIKVASTKADIERQIRDS